MVTPNFTALFNPVKNVPKITEREMRQGFNRLTRPNPSMLGGAADIPMGLLQMLGAPAVGLEEGLVRDPTVDAAVSLGADRGIAETVVDTGLLAAGFLVPVMAQRSAIKAGSLAELAVSERGMVGYHGTKHQFTPTDRNPLGEFTDEAIGSGQGAQIRGYGHYIAEGKNTGKAYMPQLRYREKTSSFPGVKPALVSTRTVEEKLKATGKSLDELGFVIEPQRGNLYKVDVPDKIVDDMLDLDKPLREQNKKIQKLFKDFDPDETGEDVYQYLLNEEHRSMAIREGIKPGTLPRDNTEAMRRVSQALLDEGIKGNKFLDQGSRAGGKGTRNWVVFDPNDIKILGRE